MDCYECHLVSVMWLQPQRLADVGPLSDMVACVKKLDSQVNWYFLISSSLPSFVVGAVVCLHFANEEVELTFQASRAG